MPPTLPAAPRARPFRKSAGQPVPAATSTIRLLEITCGLDRQQIESLLARAPVATALPFRPSAGSRCGSYRAFGVVVCCLLLSAIVAALIVSLA